jgi:hypothetical protein
MMSITDMVDAMKASGMRVECERCGETIGTKAHMCDEWRLRHNTIQKFIEGQGYGKKCRFFHKDDVIDLIMQYELALAKKQIDYSIARLQEIGDKNDVK